MNPKGIIITHGIKLEDREQKTITFLATFKNTIELIPPSHTPGTKTPDVIINGVAWEIKCPGGNNYKTIERALHRGVRQSQNIILDLRFMKIPDQKLHQIVTRLFAHSRSIRKLKIIFRSQKVVDFRK